MALKIQLKNIKIVGVHTFDHTIFEFCNNSATKITEFIENYDYSAQDDFG
jgi:hypothetical protein